MNEKIVKKNLINAVSKNEENYYCAVTAVEIIDKETTRIYIDLHGDMSKGDLKEP